MVPIRKLDPIGAIGNYWASQRQPSDQEVSLLQALADATSVAMENVQVYSELEERVRNRTAALAQANEEIHQLSVTDLLTQLNNRRGFFLLADPALELARRNNRCCLLAFLDVDGLKRVNDELGHEMGDQLITDVADSLRATLRKSDIIARLGGDEFCVLVTEPEGNPAVLRARILEGFREFNESHDRPYSLSASVGLLQTWPGESGSLEELLKKADELMYVDKKSKPGARSQT